MDTDVMLPSGRRKTAAWLVCGLADGAALLGLGFGYAEQATGRSVIPQSVLSYFAAFVVALGYASVGLALVLRRPRLVIGWVFLGIAMVAGFSNLSWAYALLDAARGYPPGPIDASESAWVANAILPSAWFVLATALVLLFPNGEPVGRRWWVVLEGSIVGGLVLVACLALLPGALLFYSFMPNPHAASGWLANLATAGTPALLGLMITLTVVGTWTMRLRYRQAGTIEREQLKWFAWASALFVAAASIEIALGGILSPASRAADIAWLLFAAAASTVPVAALIAIQRYRLYQIDRLIGRTFVYGSLTAILAGVYAASIRLFTVLFVGVTGESSDTALVLTTLVLATSFTPIKQRLEAIAGERFRPGVAADPVTVDSPEFEQRVEEIARRVSREMLAVEPVARGANAADAQGHERAE